MRTHPDRPLRIGIIGGGVAGLAAAYELAGAGDVEIHLFENGPVLGGLAAGFKGRASWDWPLEKFYHHLFTNDDEIIGLTKTLGAGELLQIHRPSTVIHYRGANYPLDSALNLLQFPHLSLAQKLRMGLVLAYLKYHPRPPWRAFDRILADQWLARKMGRTAYAKIWQPMLEGQIRPPFPGCQSGLVLGQGLQAHAASRLLPRWISSLHRPARRRGPAAGRNHRDQYRGPLVDTPAGRRLQRQE